MVVGRRFVLLVALVAAVVAAAGCESPDAASAGRELRDAAAQGSGKAIKTGVLLVSHGSHSPEWRQMLSKFGASVTPALLELDGVEGVKSAFMEYTEPSIATRLKEFDEEGFDRVILVPLLLTVSSHSFDDIPTIVGAKEDAKSLLTLEAEGIERYTPRAEVTISPLLDFSQLLEENIPRRVAALSQTPTEEGIVLVAYGSEPFNEEWEAFFTRIDEAVQNNTGVAEVLHCWCGHIAHYSKEPTKEAIQQMLSRRERAIVVPVLVARDENFQGRIIGGAIAELDQPQRIAYASDAILPDEKLEQWVVSITAKMLSEGAQATNSTAGAET